MQAAAAVLSFNAKGLWGSTSSDVSRLHTSRLRDPLKKTGALIFRGTKVGG